jgi:hypothetical protein
MLSLYTRFSFLTFCCSEFDLYDETEVMAVSKPRRGSTAADSDDEFIVEPKTVPVPVSLFSILCS